MRIPKKIKIGAQKITVKTVDTLGDDDMGAFFPGTNELLLARKVSYGVIPEDQMADTFLHEIIHAVNRNFGIGLTECQTAGLAGGLLQVIRDNNLDFLNTD